MSGEGRLVVVSNRLPIVTEGTGGRLRSSDGGLVSALMPVLRRKGGRWIGWTGTDYDSAVAESVKAWCAKESYTFAPVFLTEDERAAYYRGFSNEIIWPLFHGFPSRCRFESAYWNAYSRVNEKFAGVVAENAQSRDVIWVHDYHLMLVAEMLHRRGWRRRLGYFHHIPFPCPDVFETLPWRVQVLRGLLRFNVIGFQTVRDRRNFIECLQQYLPELRMSPIGKNVLIRAEGVCASVGTYPISIDCEAFARETGDTGVREEKPQSPVKTRTVLGVDRLDYTKGIPERLNAFRRLLERYPELRRQVTMTQIVIPSRDDIPEYEQLRRRIETLVGKINGEFSTPDWIPIHYFYRAVSQIELIGFYRAAHVAAVTPLKDGMNLVAKEFCASRIDGRGVLLLSEFAGAAEELGSGAVLVNPHDTEMVASALESALRMHELEQRARMERMQSHLRTHDVFRWCESFNADHFLNIPVAAPKKEILGENRGSATYKNLLAMG